ncbi:hypothetical protein U2261_03725 [Achromobacter xylosoxidans]|jgi:hypothetical protein|uniref:Ribosomal protein S3AE n=1 Tax=Alcaligenes xylosoxydans xylosoxydans TaxID=85698 RepID=A0A0D6IJV4_ALCXX|nr:MULTISPECIES: hypothetical protein [Achromobacter]AMH04977.1 hypothetical protein AL509_08130 [Achromobacter xylosoxidans]AXA79621.1 hypothetical protein CE206_25875 [Achromobacter xylosoxidans]EFV84373.1 hypothetical protein HMPREF0005_03312 [Achromobacter xylosoxidans C54]KAA5923157.1 hypothetical protein F1536_17780 [Achromobacter xylosoxidans]KMJ90523.1 ribosomal protein S3AE [Achromobacter xylosoxidans]
MNLPFPIRQECPPGACMCDRDRLLADPAADVRILRLTKEEEKRLVARLENITSLEDLRAMQGRMQAQLGIVVRIVPSDNEVRTSRGIAIQLDEQPGLCRKTRSSIPAAIRRGFDNKPEIVYALLNERDLLNGT